MTQFDPNIPRKKQDSPDRMDAMVHVATFLLMINQGGRAGFISPVPLIMAGLFPVFALVYILAERKVERPIIDFALFRERMYGQNMAVLFFHYVSQGSVILLTPFYLINSLGYSPFTMGLLLSAPQTMRILLSSFVGVLTDKVGSRLPVAIALSSADKLSDATGPGCPSNNRGF
ncbi:MAG: hypothetical protein IIC53_14465 [Proteobacteria bacterium]|nr:hypothetical protein [Pseudomonadota bacterium]